MSFEKLENQITDILENNHTARADDMALYACYAYDKVRSEGLGFSWLQTVFSDRRFRISHGIAPYSTISRVRRKIQAKRPDLKPTKEVIEERKKSEAEYKAYARKK